MIFTSFLGLDFLHIRHTTSRACPTPKTKTRDKFEVLVKNFALFHRQNNNLPETLSATGLTTSFLVTSFHQTFACSDSESCDYRWQKETESEGRASTIPNNFSTKGTNGSNGPETENIFPKDEILHFMIQCWLFEALISAICVGRIMQQEFNCNTTVQYQRFKKLCKIEHLKRKKRMLGK